MQIICQGKSIIIFMGTTEVGNRMQSVPSAAGPFIVLFYFCIVQMSHSVR